MPSFIGTPLQLVLVGGEPDFLPLRAGGTPLRLRITFPSTKLGPGAPAFAAVTAPELDRIQRQIPYLNANGTATVQLQLMWQRTMEAIEAALGGLTGQVGDLAVLVQQIQAALELAQAATEEASKANAALSITNSYTNPTAVLTASSTGAITIAAHVRVYGDGTQVPVNGGTLTGFAPGDYVSVYYDDAGRAGGAVAYQGATNAIAQQGDRHSVGQISIPQPGETPSAGGGVSPPGYIPRNSGYISQQPL